MPLAGLLWLSLAASLTAGLNSSSSGPALISGNSTLISPNRSFEMGFFSVDGGSRWYLGIWFASIPIRTYVWVANRDSPVPAAGTPATASFSDDGHLLLQDASRRELWRTLNAEPASAALLLDSGNLVLVSGDGDRLVWQSFDHPGDTWLPSQRLTRRHAVTSWRSPVDPSPGLFSLRLKPPLSAEFELVNGYRVSSSSSSSSSPVSYWTTGNWTGDRFAYVPEMTVPYIYAFRFDDPFSEEASFVYEETTPARRPSRFVVDSSGQLRQFTWSTQTASWTMFWARPEDPCRVYARCGDLGVCGGAPPCDCPPGAVPADSPAWSSGDFSGGCLMPAGPSVLEDVGPASFDATWTVSFASSGRRSCEDSCLGNSSCRGLNFVPETKVCREIFGKLLNLRSSASSPVLFLKATTIKARKKERWKTAALSAGAAVVLVAAAAGALARGRRRRRRRRRREEEKAATTNLRVFSYRELSAATKGFSEELGHGGFGAVFKGELADGSAVAVKRLERRHGGGEREFRAEVRTIGSVQHVNLVRLRGFCSEGRHRLLVYEYMANGPLSGYLGRRREQQPPLPWAARWRVAVGTARGLAYLHEECRDCILHCDIKPENILLDEGLTAKVADFGLARLLGRDLSRVVATMRGTWGYVAPEWIAGGPISAKADVYSYGMTLMEIVSGRRNAEEEEDGEEKWFFPAWAARRVAEGDALAVVDPLLRGEYDREEAERAAMAAVWCMQDREDERPRMGRVVRMLEGTVEMAAPPLPQLLQALVAAGEEDGAAEDEQGDDSEEHSEISAAAER
ncbi:receptor-like protein kinase 4 [Wolffia australiana]